MTRAIGLGQLPKSTAGRFRQQAANHQRLLHPIPNLGDGRPCQAADVDPDLFFPNTPVDQTRQGRMGRTLTTQVTVAKALCSTCPVIVECGAWAIQHREHGIWGGLLEWERDAIRRRARSGGAS
jgi:WhiB family redox-sensing transcriptional regulator